MDRLPTELYGAILRQLAKDDRTSTTLALTRAIPRSPVPRAYLFETIRLHKAKQVLLLYQHLRRAGGTESQEAAWVREFILDAWTVDAQIVVNLLELLPRIRVLTLSIGTSFMPEHLEEVFQAPRVDLLALFVRFRPYVERATYYQFLKVSGTKTRVCDPSPVFQGSYFDGMITHLAAWPSSSLRQLSVIQDVPPTLDHSFAQPIVFFSLEPLTALCRSKTLLNVQHFRLCIPSRQITSFLTPPMANLHNVTLLDLSTTNVTSDGLAAILVRFTGLEHLLLDDCGLVARAVEISGEFAALGVLCASSMLKKARQREKEIKEFVEAEAEAKRLAVAELCAGPAESIAGAPGKTGKGRRGVATATFSLREKPAPKTKASGLANSSGRDLPPALASLTKVRVLPSLPCLKSLSTTTFSIPTPTVVSEWRHDFARGWGDGLSMVTATRMRLFRSRANGIIRLFEFNSIADPELEAPLQGLRELHLDDPDFGAELADTEPPVLCFAGSRTQGDHTESCGHLSSWEVLGTSTKETIL